MAVGRRFENAADSSLLPNLLFELPQGRLRMALTKSIEWMERSRRVLAGGVSSDVRRAELPHPLFFQSGKGSLLVDVDGNEYID